MAILNFKYNNISAKNTKTEKVSSIKMSYSFKILSCEEFSPKTPNKVEGFLKIGTSLGINYDKIGRIELSGELFYAAPIKIVQECLEEYKKNKVLSKSILEEVNTFSFRKMVSKSFSLAEDLNLPSPYPLPKIQSSKKTK